MVAMLTADAQADLLDLPLRERRRRYEETNGHTLDDDQVLTPSNAPSIHGANGPACVVCSGPLDDARLSKQAKTCGSEACAREWRLRRRRALREQPTVTPGGLNGVAMGNGLADTRNAPDGHDEAAHEERSSGAIDVVAFAAAVFSKWPRAELELTLPNLVLVAHPRGRT
jgi:hypothetical protein